MTLEDVRGGKAGALSDRDPGAGDGGTGGQAGRRASRPCWISRPSWSSPGRDPRDELPPPLLRTDVMGMEDLKPGMELTGTVRNVIDFGAFVDIGVHQDGLVHISARSPTVSSSHPSEVLKVGDVVTVWVLSVDTQKKRIGLTMKAPKTP